MPKPKQQPVRPPTAFERLADPEGRRRAADPNLTANGAVRANRAAQFMPFAALTGYYELVRKQEITVESKRELTEEKALVLSKKLEGLKRGDLVRVTYYDTYGYRSRTGILDAFFRLYAMACRSGASPKPFLDWLREDYDEAALRQSFTSRPWADRIVDGLLRRE